MNDDSPVILFFIVGVLIVSGFWAWHSASLDYKWKDCRQYSIQEYHERVIPVRCEGTIR